MKHFRILRGSQAEESHVLQAVRLDSLVYKSNACGEPSMCLEWFRKNSDIYIFLLDEETENVIGYINAMPITERLFSEIKSGCVNDVTISADNIVEYKDNVDCIIYFCSIVVDPSYQKTTAFITLYKAFVDFMGLLVERSIYVRTVIAEALTEKGARLCKRSGFEVMSTNQFGSSIYHLSNVQDNFRPLKHSAKDLKARYMLI